MSWGWRSQRGCGRFQHDADEQRVENAHVPSSARWERGTPSKPDLKATPSTKPNFHRIYQSSTPILHIEHVQYTSFLVTFKQ
jgi:hypothetical protein